MTNGDIVAGKAGFQKADLMDYGSLYGMGSYFGQDYTAFALVRLAALTEENLAQARFGAALGSLSAEQQAAVRTTMQQQLQGVDLTRREVTIPDALAGAIGTLRGDLAEESSYDRSHDRLDSRLQLERHRSAADRRFPDLLGADYGRPASRYELVLDRELAVSAGSRQHADHQHLHVDVDQLLFHVLCVWRRDLHLSVLAQRRRRRGRWTRCSEHSGR